MRFDGRVAVVTGAGGGLGRSHALGLAARGAKVIVNDLGGSVAGLGHSRTAADAVAEEIRAAGGHAIASGASVTDPQAVHHMIAEAIAAWGRIDILVNNAGVLRDKTFSKMSLEEFRFVLDVHLMGAVNCAKAVWDVMRAQNYGRIVMTTSSSGLYGNFGQSNYSAAKMGLIGLMQTLAIEGAKHDIRVNSLAPVASTRMTEALMPQHSLDLLQPEAVTAALLYLVSEDAPSRAILCAGAGGFERAHVTLTEGVFLGTASPEQVAEAFSAISDRRGEIVPDFAGAQAELELAKAEHHRARAGAPAATDRKERTI